MNEADGSRVDAEASEPNLLNLANAFTMLRVALVPVIGVLLALEGDAARWWAFGIFVFAAWTDTIDGWVARRLVGITRWGQLADPLADKLLIVGSLAILAWRDELPWWAVVVIAAREVAVTWQRSCLVAVGVTMPASNFGKLKTVTQVAAVTLYLWPGVDATVRTAVLLVAVLATVASGLDYVGRGRRLVRMQEG